MMFLYYLYVLTVETITRMNKICLGEQGAASIIFRKSFAG